LNGGDCLHKIKRKYKHRLVASYDSEPINQMGSILR
jgi:hypothetical protein